MWGLKFQWVSAEWNHYRSAEILPTYSSFWISENCTHICSFVTYLYDKSLFMAIFDLCTFIKSAKNNQHVLLPLVSLYLGTSNNFDSNTKILWPWKRIVSYFNRRYGISFHSFIFKWVRGYAFLKCIDHVHKCYFTISLYIYFTYIALFQAIIKFKLNEF